MKSFVVAIFTALGFLAAASVANAGGVVVGPPPVTCSNQTISNGGTINTNLTIADNTRCVVLNVTITGNVNVGKGASLDISPELVAGEKVVINGNVDANQCNSVTIISEPPDISIGGNFSIKNCTGNATIVGSTIGNNLVCSNNTGSCSIQDVIVNGNATIDDNSGSAILSSKISGNLDFSGNTAPGNFVRDNTVGGNLSCKDNVPPPSLSGNTVTGNAKGQCANGL
jgi:hypothetical protein